MRDGTRAAADRISFARSDGAGAAGSERRLHASDAAVAIHARPCNHTGAGQLLVLMMNPRFRSRFGAMGTIVAALLLHVAASVILSATVRAQEASGAADPATALADALVAACRASESDFANHLTTANAAAFRALPATQRSELMKRLSLSDDPGKPLLSADADKHIVLRCRAANNTVEYRFGTTRVQENLAFIPVAVVNSQQADFGMVREGGSWRLLSLGLVLFDVPQLAKQWAAADLATQEDTAIADLRALAEAIQTYRRARSAIAVSS